MKTCAVQSKIQCVLKTAVKQAPSSKRQGQNYCVEATQEICLDAEECDFTKAIASEKFDGTCCHVRINNGRLMLCARLDRKPSKGADKRFKAYQRKHREWKLTKTGEEPLFQWKFPNDLKTVPDEWIPADDIKIDDSTKFPIPDENGHIPGWVPVESTNPQYCWHSSVIDYNTGMALTLKLSSDTKNGDKAVEISPTALADLDRKTLELIGTNINGNPYGLGSKSKPFHVLVEHGCISVLDLPQSISYESIYTWFTSNSHASVEGIVWHFSSGKMFKLHRHHLKLSWPQNDVNPLLRDRPVIIKTGSLHSKEYSSNSKSMFNYLFSLNSTSFSKFRDIFEISESVNGAV
ncbi:RNA ligase 1-like [Styela clava]